MTIKELDAVALVVDVPERGLKAGDVGAVVHVHASGVIEVEFIAASGHTHSLMELSAHQWRPVDRNDLLAVRHTDAA